MREVDRTAHVHMPVELLVGDIDRHGPKVSDALRMTPRNAGRLWRIDPYGGDVDRLVTR
jgi:hypothetical protein